MRILWRMDNPSARPQLAELASGLRLHLSHAALTVALIQIGARQQHYLAGTGCAGCLEGRCVPGCRMELLRRTLRVTGAVEHFTPRSRGLAPRPYTRLVVAWPSGQAQPLHGSVLQPWKDARLCLTWRVWRGRLVCGAVLAVGADGPDPRVRLRGLGWRAVALPIGPLRGLLLSPMPPTLPLGWFWRGVPVLPLPALFDEQGAPAQATEAVALPDLLEAAELADAQIPIQYGGILAGYLTTALVLRAITRIDTRSAMAGLGWHVSETAPESEAPPVVEDEQARQEDQAAGDTGISEPAPADTATLETTPATAPDEAGIALGVEQPAAAGDPGATVIRDDRTGTQTHVCVQEQEVTEAPDQATGADQVQERAADRGDREAEAGAAPVEETETFALPDPDLIGTQTFLCVQGDGSDQVIASEPASDTTSAPPAAPAASADEQGAGIEQPGEAEDTGERAVAEVGAPAWSAPFGASEATIRDLVATIVADPRCTEGKQRTQIGLTVSRLVQAAGITFPEAWALLLWFEVAGVLAAPFKPDQPWRGPRPLTSLDVDSILAALRTTAPPTNEQIAAASAAQR